MKEENNKSLEELLSKLPPSIKYKNNFGELKISKFYDHGIKWSVEYFFSSTSNNAPISYWDESLPDACEKMLTFLEKNKLLDYWKEE